MMGWVPIRRPRTGRAAAHSCPAARHSGQQPWLPVARVGRATSPHCRPVLCVTVYKGGLLMWQG